MRTLYYDFQIDGKPVPVPDEDVQIIPQDVTSGDSGYDESRVMHRKVVRTTESFVIQYANITTEEYQYIKSLVMGKDYFLLEHRLYGSEVQKLDAYCDKLPVFLNNAKNGTMKKMKFTISQC